MTSKSSLTRLLKEQQALVARLTSRLLDIQNHTTEEAHRVHLYTLLSSSVQHCDERSAAAEARAEAAEARAVAAEARAVRAEREASNARVDAEASVRRAADVVGKLKARDGDCERLEAELAALRVALQERGEVVAGLEADLAAQQQATREVEAAKAVVEAAKADLEDKHQMLKEDFLEAQRDLTDEVKASAKEVASWKKLHAQAELAARRAEAQLKGALAAQAAAAEARKPPSRPAAGSPAPKGSPLPFVAVRRPRADSAWHVSYCSSVTGLLARHRREGMSDDEAVEALVASGGLKASDSIPFGRLCTQSACAKAVAAMK